MTGLLLSCAKWLREKHFEKESQDLGENKRKNEAILIGT